MAALQFHHRDPETKAFGLTQQGIVKNSWEDVLVEAEKCDLVCANCHAEIHSSWSEEDEDVAYRVAKQMESED